MKQLSLIILFLASILFISCSNKDEVYEIEINETQVEIAWDGTPTSINFSTTNKWEAKVLSEWCILDKKVGMGGNSIIVISAIPNESTSSRSTQLTISSGNIQKVIAIVQQPKSSIIISKNEYEINANGGNIDIEITTNVEISVNISNDAKDWIKQIATKGTSTQILHFEVLPLYDSPERTGVIVIASDNTTETIIVKQNDSEQRLDNMLKEINSILVKPYNVIGSGNNKGYDFSYPSILCITDAATGDVVCTTGDKNSGYDWFWFWEVGAKLDSNDIQAYYVWYLYYNIIEYINNELTSITENDSRLSKAYQAYLKAIRINMYIDLARLYDPLENNYTDVSHVNGLTVPILTEPTADENIINVPRAHRSEIFNFIINELDNIEKELLESNIYGNKTCPNIPVIYGLKARAYLWLGAFDNNNYKKAAEYARKVINSSGSTILNKEQWTNKETAFNTPNSSWLWYLPQDMEGVSNLVNYIAWRSLEATWGYASLVQPGVHTNFYNRISDTDWRKQTFVGPNPQSWYSSNYNICNISMNDDTYKDYIAPYSSIKFRPASGDTSFYKVGGVTNICLMRIEEMYFIEAEATAHFNETKGIKLLKEFMLNRDTKYKISATNKEEIIEEIIWQKRVEFWGEGIIFYDLKRLNYSIATAYNGTNVPSSSSIKTEGRAPWWNFVIPDSAIYKNSALSGHNNPNVSNLVQSNKY